MENNLEYIPIEKELIPYRFEITLSNKTFAFVINYNAEHDFFTIDLYCGEKAVVFGEKVVYGRPLFECRQYDEVPEIIIIPYDLSGNETRVTWDNFNVTVFLWIAPIV